MSCELLTRARRLSLTVGLLGFLVPLTGCQQAVVGRWKLVEAVPNRQTFALDNVEFRGDGSFSATTTIEGKTTDETGTYEFDGGKLKLRPSAGGQRAYPTMLKFDRLEITNGKRHAVLQRVGR